MLQQATHLMASGQDCLLSNIQVTHTDTCTWTVSPQLARVQDSEASLPSHHTALAKKQGVSGRSFQPAEHRDITATITLS